MYLLTIQNLNPNYLPFYDYSSISSGRILFNENRVIIKQFDGYQAACQVDDGKNQYSVTLQAISPQNVSGTCGCPQSSKGRNCKHIVAAILEVNDFIENDAGSRWQYQLLQGLENSAPAKKTNPKRSKYLIVFGLHGEKYASGTTAYQLIPYRVKSQDWGKFEQVESLSSRQEQNELLDKDRTWTAAAQSVNRTLDVHTVVNLSAEGIQLYNIMQRLNDSYYGTTDFSAYLPLLASMEAPVFSMTSRYTFKERLIVLSEPAKIEAALAREGKDFSLQAGLSLSGETYTTIKGSLAFISFSPTWALAGRYVVEIKNPEVIGLLMNFPLRIPGKDEEEFREKFFPAIAKRIPVHGDVISWEDVDVDPIPRLYLRDDDGVFRATMRFAYQEHEVEVDPKADPIAIKDIPNSWGMLRIHRKMDQEERFHQELTNARYGLKRSTGYELPKGSFEIRARMHPFDFLLHAIPELVKAGFEVYGEENLKSGRLNRSKPTISLNISSGIDWFEVQATAHYGDQQVPLQQIRKAISKKERYIKLADGTIGEIPEEWLQRYKRFFALGEETSTGIRVRDFHLPLVDTLLEDSQQSDIPAAFKERRALLQRFDRIEPQPIPDGFRGELRPYQRAGIDWLHFLKEYKLGGCLADDMGLGKTIQMLAFFQLMKERGQLTSASLLVVPKSLIANWELEAGRFTPGLSILEFIGNTRKKDVSQFSQYDIILTTYGTLLRDIEFLRSYNFHYAVLDEAQNIKNPNAQSAKAARLVNAQHRLTMTGTPVENNVFELWSQFAFLNPGLLGSMEYFKREFANPIESRANEESAQTLRKLVFPFILRRTKEQVAPELPERTERILYTDFEPAQRKLYSQTRDYYRGLLMGLIEEDGIQDTRMKILEGLLRLRQICIHPGLVEQNYHGPAAKFELLLETLDTLRAENHRALIFSQFVQSLRLLREELKLRGIRYSYLDGQSAHRQQIVDEFQNSSDIPFFLISLKAGGVGLNLTAADYVIHIDPWWNPAVEMQAADRVHRIGQDKPVFIYKIIARNTVEEKILLLQEHKKELVDQIISAEGSFFKSITKEDVEILFS